MWLQLNTFEHNVDEIQAFSEWILGIGDGKIGEPNDGEGIIELLDDIVIWDFENPFRSNSE